MKVLYLFNRPRGTDLENVRTGTMHDNNFYGMLRLSHFGVEAALAEPEQYVPPFVSRLWRALLSVYFVHVPLLPFIHGYDIVFTSTAYGMQLFHTLWPFKKPKWVMYDFSITGLIGHGKSFKQKMLRWLVGKSAGIVTISRHEAEVLRERFPRLSKHIEFIPVGVDLSFFSPRQVQESIEVFAPGLDPCRDYKTLFAATKDIPTLVSLSRAIEEGKEPPPPHVRAEFFNADSIRDRYASAKVVVVSVDISNGINDAAGTTTIVEAFAMGKPVIATRTSTTESYIEDGVNGLLVPPRDPQALRNAMQKLLADEALRTTMGKRAREFVEKNCDAERVAERLAAFFRSLS